MRNFLDLFGVALVILALCFGISGCKYITAKAEAIQIQNNIMKERATHD